MDEAYLTRNGYIPILNRKTHGVKRNPWYYRYPWVFVHIFRCMYKEYVLILFLRVDKEKDV